MHPLQSKDWEQARKKMGIETLRLENYLLTVHKIPFTKYKIGYLARSTMPSKKILEKLYDFGRKNNVIFIKIEPYSPCVIPTPSSVIPSGALNQTVQGGARNLDAEGVVNKRNYASIDFSPRRGGVRNDKRLIMSSHPLFPSWTQILDLTKSEEELLKSFHSKTRYNIRLAQKKGVTVKEESNEKGFKIFAKLYFETCKRQRYFGHDYRYHRIVWDNLKNKIAHILIAYYNDVPLAAYELWYLYGIIYYVYGGTSEQYRNLMASNLLMWEAIKLGKRLGAKKFDMWGSLPQNYNYNHPWSGFTRFKEGYGTKFVKMVGSYDLVIHPLFYQLYNIIYFFRKNFLNIVTRFT